MNDLISRQAAIDALERSKDKTAKGDIGGFYNKIIQNNIEKVEALPSAQPERKKGKWIKHKDRSCWFCSYCNTDDYYAYSWNCDTGEYDFQDHYCPNCGAQMEVDDGEIH